MNPPKEYYLWQIPLTLIQFEDAHDLNIVYFLTSNFDNTMKHKYVNTSKGHTSQLNMALRGRQEGES